MKQLDDMVIELKGTWKPGFRLAYLGRVDLIALYMSRGEVEVRLGGVAVKKDWVIENIFVMLRFLSVDQEGHINIDEICQFARDNIQFN